MALSDLFWTLVSKLHRYLQTGTNIELAIGAVTCLLAIYMLLLRPARKPPNSVVITNDNNNSNNNNASNALPPIRVIDFDHFKALREFPRYPDNQDLCLDIKTIDRSNSFVVFISHCWDRKHRQLNGKFHPDNASSDKFKLCVEGISKTLKIMAPGAKKCYLWLDFGCMDQDGNPAGELKQLDEIVRNADCIFTPIHGENKNDGKPFVNPYTDYKAATWNEGELSYTHRSWCRVEMLYAANIPLIEDKARAERCFQHGFKTFVLNGVRPHLLYGTSDRNLVAPHILPPLQNSYHDQLDPRKGHLSVKADRLKIEELVESLKPYFKTVFNVGYEGGRDSSGRRSGFGIMRYEDGGIYEGNWANDMVNGKGLEKYSNGSSYEGNYVDGKRSGFGTFKFANGSFYVGNFSDNMRCGKGKMKFANGDSYEGTFENGKRNGFGTFIFVDGRVQAGNWVNDEFAG